MGFTIKTQAQDSSAKDSAVQEQDLALLIATKMTEGQRNYYQKKGKFNVVVKDLAKELNLTLPSSFNYGIRTSADAAYIYVMPAQTPKADQLKALVGGAFLNGENKPPVLTIVCESQKPGRMRPSDPKIVRKKDANPLILPTLQCGDLSSSVASSQKKE